MVDHWSAEKTVGPSSKAAKELRAKLATKETITPNDITSITNEMAGMIIKEIANTVDILRAARLENFVIGIGYNSTKKEMVCLIQYPSEVALKLYILARFNKVNHQHFDGYWKDHPCVTKLTSQGGTLSLTSDSGEVNKVWAGHSLNF